jgi:hypothetical protein
VDQTALGVALERRVVQLGLVAEGRIQAPPVDTGGVHQGLHRCAVEAVAPEDVEDAVQRSVFGK